MKHYIPRNIKPNKSQFFRFMGEQTLSDAAVRSAAYQTVQNLFETADQLWRTLVFHSNESLAVFVDAGKYLTPTQEHDLVSLTAQYVQCLCRPEMQSLIENEASLSEPERAVLLNALRLFQDTAEATVAALGNPHWVEPG